MSMNTNESPAHLATIADELSRIADSCQSFAADFEVFLRRFGSIIGTKESAMRDQNGDVTWKKVRFIRTGTGKIDFSEDI